MSQTFSPYKSPVSQVEQQKQSNPNLTGSVRKLKDSAAEAHNILATWSSLNKQGASIINDISNIKLEGLFKESSEERDRPTPLPLSLEPKCEALFLICQSMGKVVAKLAALTASVRGIHALTKNQDEIFFKGWTAQNFVSTFDSLQKMYAKELHLKKRIAENVAHANTRELLLFYSATWLHQPYIHHELLLESLLLETGHR